MTWGVAAAVRTLDVVGLERAVPRLAEILVDVVDGGAGVSFMAPLSRDSAEGYWRGLAEAIGAGYLHLFVAEADGAIAGTVQLHRPWPPNQPHRGEIAKMMVLGACRKRGIGEALIRALEARARDLGLTLLTFDTVPGSPADRFYRRLGFNCIGTIPGYALSPHGALDDTAIFYKTLA